jgi:hypothetical protein
MGSDALMISGPYHVRNSGSVPLQDSFAVPPSRHLIAQKMVRNPQHPIRDHHIRWVTSLISNNLVLLGDSRRSVKISDSDPEYMVRS